MRRGPDKEVVTKSVAGDQPALEESSERGMCMPNVQSMRTRYADTFTNEGDEF
jgi:hypothetical protein